MGAPETYGSGTVPQTSDTQRMLLVKLIIAEGGGSGGGGGGGIHQVYQFAGDPNGNVTPTTTLTCVCVDTTTGVIYQKTDGLLTSTGWV